MGGACCGQVLYLGSSLPVILFMQREPESSLGTLVGDWTSRGLQAPTHARLIWWFTNKDSAARGPGLKALLFRCFKQCSHPEKQPGGS